MRLVRALHLRLSAGFFRLGIGIKVLASFLASLNKKDRLTWICLKFPSDSWIQFLTKNLVLIRGVNHECHRTKGSGNFNLYNYANQFRYIRTK